MNVIEHTEATRLVGWRRSQLTTAGFSLPLAARVAGAPRDDLHARIERTERGGAPERALRLLAPLEAEDTAA